MEPGTVRAPCESIFYNNKLPGLVCMMNSVRERPSMSQKCLGGRIESFVFVFPLQLVLASPSTESMKLQEILEKLKIKVCVHFVMFVLHAVLEWTPTITASLMKEFQMGWPKFTLECSYNIH